MANYSISSLKLSDKSDSYVNTLPYGTCSDAAGTTNKVVPVGDFSREVGAMVVVKFTNGNTSSEPTLNVSSTGALPIFHQGAIINTWVIAANKTYQFVCEGSNWSLIGEVVDSVLSSSSTNPIQNKVVKNALDNKVDKSDGKGLSTNDYTTAEKNKLSGIAANATAVSSSSTNGNIKIDGTETMVYTHPASHPANIITGLSTVATSGSYDDLTDKPTVDTAMSLTSTNPVQNKVVTNAINKRLPLTGGNLTGPLSIGIPGDTTKGCTYDLGSYYNYANGFLIKLGAAGNATMYTIHITGNSYNGLTPFDTLVQFYDYNTSQGFLRTGGLTLGAELGTITIYRYDGYTYAHIAQNQSNSTLSFRVISNRKNLAISVSDNAIPTSGTTDSMTITLDEAITVDSALSSTSTNPVQNKVINTALSGKADVDGEGFVEKAHYASSALTSEKASEADYATEADNAATATTATKVNVRESTSTSGFPVLFESGGSCWKAANNSIQIIPASGELLANTFKGELVGNAATATKATQDANGNVIASTYATKEEIKNISGINLEYSEVTNGSTALTSAGEYSFRAEVIDDSFGGNEIRIIGKEEDVRSPLSGVMTSTFVNPFFSFAFNKGPGSSATFAQDYSGLEGSISMRTPIGSYWDTHWGWYNQKIKVPDLQFSLTLPSPKSSIRGQSTGVGFYLFARLSHPYPARNTELGPGAGFKAIDSATLRDKISNQNQNLIWFMFVEFNGMWKLRVASVDQNGGGYTDTESYQSFISGTHTISFDEEAKVYIDGEKVTWTTDQIDWPYIAGGMVVDYTTRAYLGFTVCNHMDSSYTLKINEITNKPGAILGNGDYPANAFAGGLQTTGIQKYIGPSVSLALSIGTIPYTSHTLMDDTATTPQIVGPAIYLTDASQTASYVELYMSNTDLNTFWGDTLGFGANACIIKHSDNQWYLHTRKLDGTPISFVLADRFNNPSMPVPISTQFTDYIATKTPAYIYDYVNTNSNKVGGTIENYKEITVSKNIIWDGNAAEHLFCEYDSFDGKEHKTSVSIAADGTISWTNSYENSLDGVQKLEVNA